MTRLALACVLTLAPPMQPVAPVPSGVGPGPASTELVTPRPNLWAAQPASPLSVDAGPAPLVASTDTHLMLAPMVPQPPELFAQSEVQPQQRDAGTPPADRADPPTEQPTIAPPVLTDAQLYRLRMCESTDNYGAHLVWGTQWESRASGGYQFEQPTWDGVALRHMVWLVGVKPHLATPTDQDAMTRWLWSERGRQPWPVCGWRVGAA